LASVADAVDRVAPSISPFDIVIAGAGAFPSEARPRTLWLGVEAGGDELTSAAGNLDAALAPSGWVPEDRPFRAHLTLARSDGVHSGPTVARRLIEAAKDVREPFRATSIVLFESISGDGPARYEPLHEAPLG
jgi:2'-5' RNA ligase